MEFEGNKLSAKEYIFLQYFVSCYSLAIDLRQIESIECVSNYEIFYQYHSFLHGVIPFQKNMLPVVDLRKVFNKCNTHKTNDTDIIMIVKSKNIRVGFIIDKIGDYIYTDETEYSQKSNINLRIGNNKLSGFIRTQKVFVPIFDFRNFIEEKLYQINSIYN